MRMHLLILCIIVSPLTVATVQLKTVITVDQDVYRDVMTFLDGRNPLQVFDFDSPHARRDVVDFVLIQQAVALGGIELDIRYVPGNYDARNIRSIANGMLLIGLDSFWYHELIKMQEQVFISQPLIRCGEYMAGLYTSKINERAMSARNVEQVQQLSFVSNSAWAADWHTLTALQPKELVDEPSWSSQAKLVSRGWIDVMLAPFLRGNQFRFTGSGYDIVAIPGIKMMLHDSRHVAVSRMHPDGQIVFTALEHGLTQLRSQGLIEQAYRQAGFFNDAVADWKLLNPDPNAGCIGPTSLQ